MLSACVRQTVCSLFVISLLMPADSAQAQQPSPNEPVVTITTTRSRVEITERFSKVLELKNNIVRVDGFDPSVLNVSALTSTQIRVQSLTQGVTNVVLTDALNETYTVEVFVKGDARHLQAIIDTKFPDSSIEALKLQENVLLRGWVSHPEHITQIVEVAEQFFPVVLNHMKVGGVQQVKLRVKVMEVQRARIRQLGFNFLYQNKNGFVSQTTGQLVQVAETSLPFKPANPGLLLAPETLAGPTAAFAITGDHNVFTGFLEALKEESLLKVLSEPELVVTNGRPATLLSGGEFPILVPSGLGTVAIDWREFGTRLEAVPIILGGGRLRLELQPEFSERDFTNAVDVNGFTVPGLTIRRANTQVEMRFGETLMLAGLISSRETSETDKVPFLGELPWIGAAFRRVRSDSVENELVIMVTPELVAPLEADQVPAGGPGMFTSPPLDSELFVDGLLEVPNVGDPCEGCAKIQIHSSETLQPPYLPVPETSPPPVAPAEPLPTQARSVPKTRRPGLVAPTPAGGAENGSAEDPVASAFSKQIIRTNRVDSQPMQIVRPAGGSATRPGSFDDAQRRPLNPPTRTDRPASETRPGLIEP